MVLDVSYSRVLGQRPTFYCPLFFLRKTGNSPQAIRRNRLWCFHVWFVSDHWQWVAPRFGRVCTGCLLVYAMTEPWIFTNLLSDSALGDASSWSKTAWLQLCGISRIRPILLQCTVPGIYNCMSGRLCYIAGAYLRYLRIFLFCLWNYYLLAKQLYYKRCA